MIDARKPPEPFVELTDQEWNAAVDAELAANPGLFPRHAAMFVTFREDGRRADHNAALQREADLEFEREKGRAFAQGMNEVNR